MDSITLGDITIEIPPERQIDFTGNRAMVKYDVPGDRPHYQDLGREERTVSWNGIFYGEGAFKKAKALQAYYDSGANTDVGDSTSGFLFRYQQVSCRVLIKSFSYQYQRKDKVRYDIELVRLESDYDPKAETPEDLEDEAEQAKSWMDNLNDAIDGAMKGVREVSQMARDVEDTIFQARKAYLNLFKKFKPLADLRQQYEDIKFALDRARLTVNHSIGHASTPKKRQELQQTLVSLQQAIPLAKQLIMLSKSGSYNQRLNELISNMKLHQVVDGENLRSIAADLLGQPHQWILLAQINRLPTAQIPPEVRKIRIPDITNLAQVEKLLDEERARLPRVTCDYLPESLR